MTLLILPAAAAGAGVVAAYFGVGADYGGAFGTGGGLHRRTAAGRSCSEGIHAAVACRLRGGE